jgi:hypothetical protein
VVNLESPLPASLPPGAATALFCYGTCFHRQETVTGLSILVDGVPHPPAATRMPRPDVSSSEPRGYRSGFWGTVPIAGRAPGAVAQLAVAARLRGGSEHVIPVGRIEVVEPPPTPTVVGPIDPDLIAVCMATYEPNMELFRAQIESLRAQTDRGWLCVISDDCSSLRRFEELTSVVDGDTRFVVSRAERRLGFYRNFERAIRMAPKEARLLALCDQDDRWWPEKLQVLREALGSAQLVYSDQRLVDAGGRVLRDTMWRGRRNNHTDLASLLIANTITGAASLFRRDVAELALPFPDTPGLQFHDHWLGLVALACGDVAYVDRPLYDYVQHGGAVFGEVTGGTARRRPTGRGIMRGGRGAYFLGYVPREVQAQALLIRCAGRLTGPKRRALRRYAASAGSVAAFVWLALRPLRALTGRNETLGSEGELVRGIVWRWLVVVLARGGRTPWRRWCDARFPDPLSFEQRRLRRWRARSGHAYASGLDDGGR